MKKLTTEEWITKAKTVHNDKYDYSLVKYSNCKDKIKIICPEHGEFDQTPDNHIRGKGCSKCTGVSTTEDFIIKAKEVHNERYNYTLTVYNKSADKVIIICPEHGQFKQIARNHLFGAGCSKCFGNTKLTLENFITRAKEVHGKKYDYSLSTYVTIFDKVMVICPIHGVFEVTPNNHINHESGCPVCKTSKGEKKIEEWLSLNNFQYIQQKRFTECVGKRNPLPFDFYLTDYNICIEFDGEQHFTPMRYKNKDKCLEKFKQTQLYDKVKTQYCIDNNIKLIRIPFNEFNNIENILQKDLL